MWHHPRLTDEQKKRLCLQARQIIEFERSLDPSAYPDVELLPPRDSVELFRVEDAEIQSLSESATAGDVQLLKTDGAPESSR